MNVKSWIKEHLAKTFSSCHRKHSPTSPVLYGDSFWYDCPNLWEPSVLIALKDLCRPGMTVFDVGANMGGLTSAISRLVGPHGMVCSFEASPRIIGHLQANVVKQGHHNVFVYHRAVFSKSNSVITIYEGFHLNDSIFADNSPSKVGRSVKTVALDDFYDSTGLVPEVIKMDIEGAEYDALLGAKRLIGAHRPHLLLEQQGNDGRCFNFLANLGYRAVDLATYQEILSITESSPPALLNILYAHTDVLSSTPYKLPIKTADAGRIDLTQFAKNDLRGLTSKSIPMTAGRYLFDADFTASDTSNNLMCGVKFNGVVIFRYNAYSKLLAENYRKWVVDLPFDGEISIYFDFIDGTSDESFRLKEVRMRKLEGISTSTWAKIAVD